MPKAALPQRARPAALAVLLLRVSATPSIPAALAVLEAHLVVAKAAAAVRQAQVVQAVQAAQAEPQTTPAAAAVARAQR